MILLACVDDRMGMLFNHRRLSRDRELYRDMLTLCGGHLLVSSGSASLFDEFPEKSLQITDSPIPCEAWYFAEDPGMIPPDGEGIDAVILYRWNRKYPADRYFPLDLDQWEMTERVEFPGSSHETITRERYERKSE